MLARGTPYCVQLYSTLAALEVLPDMKIVFLNSTVISASNTLSVVHMFSPLKLSDSGEYTCEATINIPGAGITNLKTTITNTLAVVQCKSMHGTSSSFAYAYLLFTDA